jgi:hypothetical protein
MSIYTIVKFIANQKFNPMDEFSYPLVSRTLGKVLVPAKESTVKLDPFVHHNTFWVVKLLNETHEKHRGLVLADVLFETKPISLLPGMFSSKVQGHWVYLVLGDETPVKPYTVPKTVKHNFLYDPKGYSVVCIPYTEDQLELLKSNSNIRSIPDIPS